MVVFGFPFFGSKGGSFGVPVLRSWFRIDSFGVPGSGGRGAMKRVCSPRREGLG